MEFRDVEFSVGVGFTGGLNEDEGSLPFYAIASGPV